MDSTDKIITRYFATFTKKPFTYKGKTYEPSILAVSPMLLRGVDCPAGCGGCCRKFSLDWLPKERAKVKKAGYDMGRVKPRDIEFDGRVVRIISDTQEDTDQYWCRNLGADNGRCGIHTFSPMSCDFELIRTIQTREDLPNRLTQKLFGRGWAMKRITDGERGSMCSMTGVTDETIKSVIRRLKRFQGWADHFGVETWVPTIIEKVEHGIWEGQMFLDPNTPDKVGFGL